MLCKFGYPKSVTRILTVSSNLACARHAPEQTGTIEHGGALKQTFRTITNSAMIFTWLLAGPVCVFLSSVVALAQDPAGGCNLKQSPNVFCFQLLRTMGLLAAIVSRIYQLVNNVSKWAVPIVETDTISQGLVEYND